MTTFVLVHPAWFGGWCWKKLASRLRHGGHVVHTPTLTGLGERWHLASPSTGLSLHVTDVEQVLLNEDLHDVVLVGNSSAGTVITGVADRLAPRVRQLVYLDAFVPSSGQSTWDLISPQRRAVMEALVATEGFGWFLPRFAPEPWEQFVPEAWQVSARDDLAWVLERLRPTPLRHFTEPLYLGHADVQQPARVYVRCTGNPHPGFDRHAEVARSSADWGHRELATAHLPYITDADSLTDLLVDVAA